MQQPYLLRYLNVLHSRSYTGVISDPNEASRCRNPVRVMSSEKKETLGFALLISSALIVLGAVLIREPIPQDLTYHAFADRRKIGAIPNFWNVISNFPFIIAGLIGIYKLKSPFKLNVINEINHTYLLLFAGTFFVGFGSGYYHLAPENQTLVWDRLPMTIAFMALFSIIISEFISLRTGIALLLPLIISGVISVIYWHIGEINHQGDLRFYALVQFYPMLAIPIILSCYHSSYTHAQAYWWMLLTYIIAKVCEYFDTEIYNILGFISGHSLKHIFAALGIFVLLYFYQKRSCHKYGVI
ncbi:Expressed protein precursor [hydrothermal vent metagenome]|uniref:Expressed protein n=1 Tax=hydrothermal vent metagenome TaxID=652676 RepID=A0A3B1C369_9ZZZZ